MENTIKDKLLNFVTLKALRERRRVALSKEAHQAELEQINNTYFRLFNSNDGKFVLNHMAKMHLAGSVAEQGDNLLDIGVKQGMANHVKEIIQRIEIARIGK